MANIGISEGGLIGYWTWPAIELRGGPEVGNCGETETGAGLGATNVAPTVVVAAGGTFELANAGIAEFGGEMEADVNGTFAETLSVPELCFSTFIN